MQQLPSLKVSTKIVVYRYSTSRPASLFCLQSCGLEDNLGSSERLLTSPVPLFYTRHASRFVSVWLAFLPLAMYEPFKDSWNHVAMIPAVFFVTTFMLGIDELATQLEEPFTILPMQSFCDKIYNWCMEIMSWEPGDYGRAPRPVKPEHKYFAAVSAPNEAFYY
jgi:Bestrophin, RFP-TM, chloride channel